MSDESLVATSGLRAGTTKLWPTGVEWPSHSHGPGPATLVAFGVGYVLVVAGMLTWGFANGYVPMTDPSQGGHGLVYPVLADTAQIVLHAGLIAVGLVLCGGITCIRYRRPACAGTQLGGAVLAISAVALGFTVSDAFFFASPGETCQEASCWPMYQQSALAASPAMLAALALAVTALTSRRLTRQARVLVPVSTWVVAVVLVQLAWRPLVLPWLALS